MEVGALFGRFVWRVINIYDVTIHPSRDSRTTLKVCEHNRAAHVLLDCLCIRTTNFVAKYASTTFVCCSIVEID